MRILIGIYVFLCACAPLPRSHKYVLIMPEAQPFVAQFIVDASNEGHPVVINNLIVQLRATLPPTWIASCTTYETPVIDVLESFWKYANNAAKELVLYHELGHCILHRHHLNTWTNYIPTSIMSEQLFDVQVYTVNRTYYVHELFNY